MPESTPVNSKYTIAFLMNGGKSPRGAEFLIFNLITRLQTDNIRPILIFAKEGTIVKKIKESGIDTFQIPLGNKITKLFIKDIIYNPVKLIRFVFSFAMSMYFLKVIKLLKKNNVNLIYSTDTLSKITGGVAGKWLGIKVVAHCHADYSSRMFQNMTGRLLKIIDSLLLDEIIAVSDKVRIFFKNYKIFPNVKTIYNGIDTNFYNPDKIDNKLIDDLNLGKSVIKIGIIGSIEKFKGQIYLIKALEKLNNEGVTNLLCLVCGTGPEKENLKKYVIENKMDKQVLFLGFREDIPNIMKILDILVIASFVESFSLVAAEAMAMKVPVIATNIGGLPEVIDNGKTGILVPPGDVNALSDAIKYLIQNPKIRSDMGESGRARVIEKFTIEKNVSETEKIFLDLIEGNS